MILSSGETWFDAKIKICIWLTGRFCSFVCIVYFFCYVTLCNCNTTTCSDFFVRRSLRRSVFFPEYNSNLIRTLSSSTIFCSTPESAAAVSCRFICWLLLHSVYFVLLSKSNWLQFSQRKTFIFSTLLISKSNLCWI